MNKTIIILLLSGMLFFDCAGQKNIFNAVYPIGDNPSIGYKTSMTPSLEKILFEANPILRMPLYNNILRHFQNSARSGSTLYFGFRPQLRMYTDNSLPVKTPSYKISILGYQKLIRLRESRFAKNHLLAFAIESGHYSNGQAGCAFDKNIPDGSPACDSIYKLITPGTDLSKLLNRESGNFSTNYTELIINYRYITEIDEDNIPRSGLSVKAGWNRYHDRLLWIANIGGYSDNDIKIYGRNRFMFGIDYFKSINKSNWLKRKLSVDRFSGNINAEYISKPHPFVKPLRIELTATAYLINNVGIFISGIFGHDNYNFRFVDSGSQFFAGICFDIFPPIEIK
ncbi:MAG: hypothetical protein QM737_13580 [Ferruginibacter sp.]